MECREQGERKGETLVGWPRGNFRGEDQRFVFCQKKWVRICSTIFTSLTLN